jgi:beta-lactamase superfamily II metal-dependent hydrolase
MIRLLTRVRFKSQRGTKAQWDESQQSVNAPEKKKEKKSDKSISINLPFSMLSACLLN